MACQMPHCSGLIAGLRHPIILVSLASVRRAASNSTRCECALKKGIASSKQLAARMLTLSRATSGVASASRQVEGLPLSPAVRSLVDANHIDPSQVRGTGPKNRILKGDVLDYLQAMKTRAAKPVSPVTNRTEQIQPSLRTPSQQPPTSSPKVVTPAPGKPPSPPIPGKTPAAPIPGKSPAVPPRTLRYTDIPIDEAQRNRGNSLAQWKFSVPSCYATSVCTVDALLEMKASIEGGGGGGDQKLDIADFFIKAAALTLERLPEANSIWDGTQSRRLLSVDISVAVETKGGPLSVLLKNVNTCSLWDIAFTMQKLSESGVKGSLTPGAQQGGSIDLSFLGPYGVREYTASISPSHSASLAIGALQVSPGLPGAGISRAVTVTMACDARVLDYELACRWLEEFKRILESPSTQGLL